jgi:hypothetical protein
VPSKAWVQQKLARRKLIPPLHVHAHAHARASQARVQQKLAEQGGGLGLTVFDGYRPLSVTRLFWEWTPPHLKEFVAGDVFLLTSSFSSLEA